MKEEKIRMFFLSGSIFIIGKESGEFIEDVVQVGIQSYLDKNTQKQIQVPFCVPLGFPFNKKENRVNINKLNYLIEIDDIDDSVINTYKSDISQIKNPNIIQPKTNQIIH